MESPEHSQTARTACCLLSATAVAVNGDTLEITGTSGSDSDNDPNDGLLVVESADTAYAISDAGIT
jgi:hypothetical protein